MPVDTSSDFEKLQKAFTEITASFGSVDSLLRTLGLAEMPTAQRYGILFGCLVFFLTISAVISLLILGGSFQRIADQAKNGQSATVPESHTARKERALLLERLLEARMRMMKDNYPHQQRSEDTTNLTKMLINVAPSAKNNATNNLARKKDDAQQKEEKKDDGVPYIPPGYEENYVHAYRRCQDQPGGAVLAGRPEARFEAYARSYAGCGNCTDHNYRRSYARIYESIACLNHASDDKFAKLFKERPHDLVGRTVRLEAAEPDRHVQPFHSITNGEPTINTKAYDPNEVWCFLEEGPFENAKELRSSFVFQRQANEAGFVIVENVTNYIMGIVLLSNDDPKNLTIQLEPPIIKPSGVGKEEQLEACYLLMDRLFALGYRRVQMAVDSQDGPSKALASRLGFTFEGVLLKHMIIKEASRDSSVFGMLNSDWSKGARNALFRKIYGSTALRADVLFNRKEEELEEQQRKLKEMKESGKASVEKDKKA